MRLNLAIPSRICACVSPQHHLDQFATSGRELHCLPGQLPLACQLGSKTRRDMRELYLYLYWISLEVSFVIEPSTFTIYLVIVSTQIRAQCHPLTVAPLVAIANPRLANSRYSFVRRGPSRLAAHAPLPVFSTACGSMPITIANDGSSGGSSSLCAISTRRLIFSKFSTQICSLVS